MSDIVNTLLTWFGYQTPDTIASFLITLYDCQLVLESCFSCSKVHSVLLIFVECCNFES